jgi:hypothetical protein
VAEVERLAVGRVAGLDGAADLVGGVRVEEDPVRADLQRLEGGPGLGGGRRARDEVRLVADPRDEVLQRDDRPVLTDDHGEFGLVGGCLGELLVLGAEDADVRSLRAVVAAAQRGQVRRPGEVLGHRDRPVALAALADEVRVGLRVALGVVDHVGVGAERRHVHVAELPDAADVVLVDEHPVRAGLDGRRDPSLARLPVADRAVGFDPDRACHYRHLSARRLENCGRVAARTTARRRQSTYR